MNNTTRLNIKHTLERRLRAASQIGRRGVDDDYPEAQQAGAVVQLLARGAMRGLDGPYLAHDVEAARAHLDMLAKDEAQHYAAVAVYEAAAEALDWRQS